MFKNFLDKTKEAAKNAVTAPEQVEEADSVANAKASVKNMKWSLKLLIQLAKGYYVTGNKQVETGGEFSKALESFSEKTSHTSYITNQTVPLSVALKETADSVKNTQIYFQQYSQLFADKFANQLQNLYTTHVKKLAQLVKQQEEIRFRYNLATSNLKSAQKSGTTGTKLAERQTDYDNNKAHYDKVNENLERSVKEMVAYVQKEVAIAMKSFVADQQLLVQEGIKIWTQSENKIFGVESPVPNTANTEPHNPPISLDKLSIQDPQPFAQEPYQQPPQYHNPEQDQYQPPQTTSPTSPTNPFDDKNPFDSNL